MALFPVPKVNQRKLLITGRFEKDTKLSKKIKIVKAKVKAKVKDKR
jgi:hypothetical protein